MGMGLNVELVEAKPWPPEEPPIAGIPEWLGKYWPALAITGIAISLVGIFAFKKKK